ncbi:MAG: hypothetical protein J6Q15_02695, partial [Clostridia bacterium]|nr:hypothetical protein [Clostridia bacterium]
IPSRRIGIYAYSISSVVAFVIAGVLNLYALERSVNNIVDIKYLTKQFALTVLAFGLLVLFKLFTSTTIFVLGSIFTAIIYLIGVYLIKLFNKEEIDLFINNE